MQSLIKSQIEAGNLDLNIVLIFINNIRNVNTCGITNELNKFLINEAFILTSSRLLKFCFYFPCPSKNYLKSFYVMKIAKVQGRDDIPCHILKEFYPIFIDRFPIIAKKFINESIYPELLKTSKIRHLYKKGIWDLINNYRPILLLNSFNSH